MNDVKPGQVWADNDPRCAGRTIRVHHIDGDKAVCAIVTNADGAVADRVGTTTRIALRRFVSTSSGYRLLSEG